MIDNPALRDTAGNTAVRNPNRTFLLSPGQRISMEEEVFTPQRGGGRPAPEPQGVPREVRAVPKPFPDGFQEDRLEGLGHAPGGKSRTKNTSHLTGDTAGGAHDDESAAVRRNY